MIIPGILYVIRVRLASTMKLSIMIPASSVHSATIEVEVNSSRIAHLLRILSADVDQAPNLGRTAATSLELTRHPASDSLDAVCEDRSLLATLLWETQRPTFRPTTVQSTTVWPRTSELPSPPTLVTPEGPAFAVLLGLGLGLLAPLTVLLALYLLRKAWRLPNTPKPCWGNSFRTPIQEEHTDAHFTLAKI